MNNAFLNLVSPSTTVIGECDLLELFAPSDFNWRGLRDARDSEPASLLRLDAIHRARNLAQMSTALANLVGRRPAFATAPEAATPARALARLYESLSTDCGDSGPLPCFELISQVAGKLAQIFGSARGIEVEVIGNEILLAPEIRRNLILMCSELIINALKYAFPPEGPGRITVSLGMVAGGLEMVVEDDGRGAVAAYIPGHGSDLLERLALSSGAVLTRSAGSGDRGLRVAVWVPSTA